MLFFIKKSFFFIPLSTVTGYSFWMCFDFFLPAGPSNISDKEFYGKLFKYYINLASYMAGIVNESVRQVAHSETIGFFNMQRNQCFFRFSCCFQSISRPPKHIFRHKLYCSTPICWEPMLFITPKLVDGGHICYDSDKTHFRLSDFGRLSLRTWGHVCDQVPERKVTVAIRPAEYCICTWLYVVGSSFRDAGLRACP